VSGMHPGGTTGDFPPQRLSSNALATNFNLSHWCPECYESFKEMLRTQNGVDDQKYQVAVNRVYEHDSAVEELRQLGVTV